MSAKNTLYIKALIFVSELLSQVKSDCHENLEIANCSIKHFPLLLGDFGQALLIRSCHKDVILTRKSHNCAGTAFVQGDTAGGSKLIEQTLKP